MWPTPVAEVMGHLSREESIQVNIWE